MRTHWWALSLAITVCACASPEHEPLNVGISGSVINVANPTGVFNGVGAGAIADLVDIGVIFLGTEIPPLGSGPVLTDGTFDAAEVDVALAGIDSPLLAIVDDRDVETGIHCDDEYFGSMFPTLSGVAADRPKTDEEAEDIDDALIFAIPSLVARLLVIVAAETSDDIEADTLQCERGFIVGFVADMSTGEPVMIEGAVVHPPAVVEQIIYLEQKGGFFAPADTTATTALGAFVAWYGADFTAASTTDLDDFTFTATGPDGEYSGFGLAVPKMAMVAALLPEGQGI